jgi:hypothetical protein
MVMFSYFPAHAVAPEFPVDRPTFLLFEMSIGCPSFPSPGEPAMLFQGWRRTWIEKDARRLSLGSTKDEFHDLRQSPCNIGKRFITLVVRMCPLQPVE